MAFFNLLKLTLPDKKNNWECYLIGDDKCFAYEISILWNVQVAVLMDCRQSLI